MTAQDRLDKINSQLNSSLTDLNRLHLFYNNLTTACLFTEAEVIKSRILDVISLVDKLLQKETEILKILGLLQTGSKEYRANLEKYFKLYEYNRYYSPK